MTDIQRYTSRNLLGGVSHATPEPGGEYVLYADHHARIAELEADYKRLCDWMGEAVSRVEQMGVLGLVDDADLFDIFREAAHQQAHHND